MFKRSLSILIAIMIILTLTPNQSSANYISKEEKINNIADKYNTSQIYIHYIIDLEKELELEPYSLLAIIAIESGFEPQTRMDAGSISYNTTQMKMNTAKTAYMVMVEHFDLTVGYPTDYMLRNNKYYAAYLAGGYLKYLSSVYEGNYYESYTAYNWGISGRMMFYNQYGHFQSSYALKVVKLQESFKEYIRGELDEMYWA